MTYIKAHISSKYQIVIPKGIRALVKLYPKQTFIVYAPDNDTIVLKKQSSSIKNLKGTGTFSSDYLDKERLRW